jgi:hypothetical protein
MDRFIAVQEPTCTWAVFDTFDNVPAEFGGVVMIGLEEPEATELASLANTEWAPRKMETFAWGGLRLVVGRAA